MSLAYAARRFARGQFLSLMRAAPTVSATAFLPLAARHGVKLHITKAGLALVRDNRTIRLAHEHQSYVPDLLAAFDYYHGAVEPTLEGGVQVADYTGRRAHKVRGYDLHPIAFPSIPEPAETADEYMRLAALGAGDVVIDLGAYAGLTSVMFDQRVGPAGAVAAIEADEANSLCVQENLAAYKALTGRTVQFRQVAVWREDGELVFSNEGAMGSSAVEFVGGGRGRQVTVPARTLATLADELALPKVDFIKCDIEGAEAAIFDQPAFFSRFRPRIVIEVHIIEGQLTSGACRQALGKFGYSFEEVGQPGTDLPLLVCRPT